jgi:mono/diheme cytochrome c family protein
MRALRIFGVIAAVIGIVAVVAIALAWRTEMDPDATAATAQFDPNLVREGAKLAAMGNCVACHTVPGSKAFAGGLELPTPFGKIYSTNITPDPETGIGLWSEAAFQRAMREGVDRRGRHLYPAFPYDHFTLVSDEDNRALYAYLMTREPVRAVAPANELRFPFNIRLLIAGWKLLFFKEGPFVAQPQQSAEWNRGAYLSEGLGHCGGCHTPRNSLGAEEQSKHFAGGEAEGWQAYAINSASPAPIPWNQESMAFYLRNGWHELHGVSRGPMAEVTGNLGAVPDADVRAIATYVVGVMGEPSEERRAEGERLREAFKSTPRAIPSSGDNSAGAAIYKSACSTCHDSGQPLPFGGLNFELSTAVDAPNPQNIINVTLFGLPPNGNAPGSIMPAYESVLNDRQMVDLLTYLRQRYSKQPMWNDLAGLVSRTRSGEYPVVVLPADGIERAPANVGAPGTEVSQ